MIVVEVGSGRTDSIETIRIPVPRLGVLVVIVRRGDKIEREEITKPRDRNEAKLN